MKVSEAASRRLFPFLTQNSDTTISVGDIITGRVVDVDNGLLLMQLLDGSRISAQVQTDSKYTAGDVLKLNVAEERQGQYYVQELEHIPQNASGESAAEEPALLLKSMNLQGSQHRLEIVKAILDMGIKPTAEWIERANYLMSENQVTSAEQAVFLALNDMDDKESYFPLIKQFEEGTFQFQQKWLSLADQIRQMDENTVINIARAFANKEFVQQMEQRVIAEDVAKIINPDQNPQPLVNDKIMATRITQDILPTLVALHGESDFSGLQDKTVTRLVEHFFQDWNKISRPRQEEVIQYIKKRWMEVAGKTNINSRQEANQMIERSMVRLRQEILVKTSEASVPKADEWMKDIEQNLRIIEETVIQSGGAESQKILPAVRELETAIRFFQDIVSYETFVQIPFELKENTSQGALYLMKRKGKHRKIDAADFSLFLSLGTQNLGIMDTFVHVRNKNVMLRVMMENERFFELLSKEFKPLYEALKRKGFHLYDLKYALRENGIDLFNAVKKAEEMAPVQDRKIDYKI